MKHHLAPADIVPLAMKALQAVADLPPEQQQAVLEAAAAIARSSTELRTRLYMLGSVLTRR
jgi:hypothetical protein